MIDPNRDFLSERIGKVLTTPSDRIDILVSVAMLDPSRDLTYGNWTEFDFSNSDIRGFNFFGSDLTGAIFRNSFIEGIILDQAIYEEEQLKDAVDYDLYRKRKDLNLEIQRELDASSLTRTQDNTSKEDRLSSVIDFCESLYSSKFGFIDGEYKFEQTSRINEIRRRNLGESSVVASIVSHTLRLIGEDVSLAGHFLDATEWILLDTFDHIKSLSSSFGLVHSKQFSEFTKLLLSSASDMRVIIMMISENLISVRGMAGLKTQKQAADLKLALGIFAPLARRLGLNETYQELETRSFMLSSKDEYAKIASITHSLYRSRGGDVDFLIENIKSSLLVRGLTPEIYELKLTDYEIFKITNGNIDELHERLRPIVCVISSDYLECYSALGVIFSFWKPVLNTFKDFISCPKPSGYKSLHVTVLGPQNQEFDLRFCTRDMHQINEAVIDVDDFYDKEVGESDHLQHLVNDVDAFVLLRKTVGALSEGVGCEGFQDNAKVDLFQDQVFCFTPKGLLIALPRGATPIDFAYAVHTNIGNTCVGCKINGRITPLVTELKNGDEVEIIRSKAQVPPPTWETIAITGKARAGIRRATREATRKQFASLGRQVLETVFSREGPELTDALLEQALPRLSQPTVPDLLAAVGRAEVPSADVLKACFPDYHEERAARQIASQRLEGGWFPFAAQAGIKFHGDSDSIRAHGLSIRTVAADLPVRFAPDGGAVPGDRIVGIVEPDVGITIYPIQSPALLAFDDKPDRWLDVRWDIDSEDPIRFPTRISIQSFNEPGSLARIAKAISDSDGAINNIKVAKSTIDFHEILVDLAIFDVKHLMQILRDVLLLNNVTNAERIIG